jgi:hypothetical protein
MNTSNQDQPNIPYIVGVSVITFLLPPVSGVAEHVIGNEPLAWVKVGKWFIFYAVGLRLFLAGLRQSLKPAFTAKAIFHMEGTEAYPVIRELGFANLCFGLIGLISLFVPQWRMVSAFGSGIYYGLAAGLHLFRKADGINERFALYTDILIFAALTAIFVCGLV